MGKARLVLVAPDKTQGLTVGPAPVPKQRGADVCKSLYHIVNKIKSVTKHKFDSVT